MANGLVGICIKVERFGKNIWPLARMFTHPGADPWGNFPQSESSVLVFLYYSFIQSYFGFCHLAK